MKALNKEVYIFDLDDTLSESKKDLTTDVALQLVRLLELHRVVAIISGCSFAQMKNQFLSIIKNHLDSKTHYKLYLLPSSGCEIYKVNCGGSQIQPLYEESLSLREKVEIINAFDYAKHQLCHNITGEYGPAEEDRGGQITFSLLGQDAPLCVKQNFDSDFSFRKLFVQNMKEVLGEDKYELTVGGKTSIDVTLKDRDKAYGVKKLLEFLPNTQYKDIIFFADALQPGGNDYSVKQLGIDSVHVKGYTDTLDRLKELLHESTKG